MLKTFVKISAVNNLSDARYCAGMMVDQLGFRLDDDQMNSELFEAITGWVEGVSLVGEFETGEISKIKNALLDYKVSHVQVSDSDLLEELASLNYKIVLKTNKSDLSHMTEVFSDQVDYFLLEDDSLTVEELELLPAKEKLVLASLIEVNQIDKVLNMGFKGIAMQGGNEQRPGVKDFDALADVLEMLEEE